MISYLISKGMTLAESKVVQELLNGKSNKEIAAKLNISEKTVKFHLTKAYRKENVKSRSEFICKYLVVSPVVLLQNNNHASIHKDAKHEDLT